MGVEQSEFQEIMTNFGWKSLDNALLAKVHSLRTQDKHFHSENKRTSHRRHSRLPGTVSRKLHHKHMENVNILKNAALPDDIPVRRSSLLEIPHELAVKPLRENLLSQENSGNCTTKNLEMNVPLTFRRWTFVPSL